MILRPSQRVIEGRLIGAVQSAEVDGVHGRLEGLLASAPAVRKRRHQRNRREDLGPQQAGIGTAGRRLDRQFRVLDPGVDVVGIHAHGDQELLAGRGRLAQHDRLLHVVVGSRHYRSVGEDR